MAKQTVYIRKHYLRLDVARRMLSAREAFGADVSPLAELDGPPFHLGYLSGFSPWSLEIASFFPKVTLTLP